MVDGVLYTTAGSGRAVEIQHAASMARHAKK
jgi:hypothetical protein